jgi:hypothetical protein
MKLILIICVKIKVRRTYAAVNDRSVAHLQKMGRGVPHF